MSAGTDSFRRGLLKRLLLAGIAWNVAEGLIAVAAGLAAGSISLVGFGLDSGIETFASYMAWKHLRAQADRTVGSEESEERERRLERRIGWTFLLLAGYIGVQALADIAFSSDVLPSRTGVALTAISLAVMPALGFWKLRLARRLASRGLESEAKETIACAILSFLALLGTGLRLAGWPAWVDPAAALLMIPWLVREGLEGIRGEE